MNIDIVALKSKAVDLLLSYGPKFLLALLTLVIGFWIVNRIVKILGKVLDKSKMDPAIKPFILSILGVLFKALILISVASMVGIATTSFVAILGAAGLAVGMALQGSLANFAGGVLILLFKPFTVGDYIKSDGEEGLVKEIQIFQTIIETLDSRIVILPNGNLSNNKMQNFTRTPNRRVTFKFGIGYEDSMEKAISIINECIDGNDKVLKSPEPAIGVTEHGDSSVNITAHCWVKNSDYWPIQMKLYEAVKTKFDQSGISIPFPQMDVHMKNT